MALRESLRRTRGGHLLWHTSFGKYVYDPPVCDVVPLASPVDKPGGIGVFCIGVVNWTPFGGLRLFPFLSIIILLGSPRKRYLPEITTHFSSQHHSRAISPDQRFVAES